jgi:aryl-alcohol dehydrogenase-like predicted oxidoreductase
VLPPIGVSALRAILGRSGVEVSRLCLGLGSSGCGSTSMQGRLRPEEVAAFLLEGGRRGATWWDTSDDYGSHAHVREALRSVDRAGVEITTKSHAREGPALRLSLERSLRELGTDYVDVFLLHEVDSLDDLRARGGAVEMLARLRDGGLARAVGLSTHNIDVLEEAAGDPRFDVLLTNYNVAGVHMDADHADYAAALRRAFRAGQGVAVMKTLGEGVLASRYHEAFAHNLGLEFVHGVLLGVTSLAQTVRACELWHAMAAPDGSLEASPPRG